MFGTLSPSVIYITRSNISDISDVIIYGLYKVNTEHIDSVWFGGPYALGAMSDYV
jgi:hypothetical protein